ncbi:MAG TPA: DUF6259 domain-containing protein [Bryobacteraceae bacterium]|nr:DUF6259 domain-containing protein [Bryobacteraceae bacterium]
MKYGFACWLVGMAMALAGATVDLQAPGGGSVTVEPVEGNRVKVATDHWRLEFDLRNGGILDTIVFPHGSAKNLLVRPLHTFVDQWSDGAAPNTAFQSSRDGNVQRLEFSGQMGTAGRQAGPVAFRTTWTISPYTVRADHTIRFAEDVMVSSVGVGNMALRADLNEFGLRVGPTDDPDRRRMAPAEFGKVQRAGDRFIAEHHAPVYLLFFHRSLEGLDLTTASGLETWEKGLAGRGGAGRYEAALAEDGSSIELLREVLRVPRPVRVRKGEYTFSYYLGLPRIVEKSNRKWRHLSFGNHPWPSDAEVARWAEAGVNIVRLHNDYASDENFWHDGAWPPYDEAGMAEMRRVIAACHRHGIQVVPYFSMHEFHPKAQGYAEHEAEWKRTTDQLGTVFHNFTGKGEFGAQMCLQSGWLARRKADIERAYRELGFDGIYYDWVMELACDNKNHDPKLHLGTDGVMDLLAWTRRLLAPKNGTLILHLYGKMPSIAFENYADLVVNMEEVSGAQQWMKISEIPVVTMLAESLPRSPCPSYRQDFARERNQNNISILSVLGMFPWSGGTGDGVYEETLKLFRAFRPYHLEQYRFHDAYSGVVETAWDDVYGAVYGSENGALVVVSNTSKEPRKNVVWRVKPEALGFRADRVSVKDATTGTAQSLPASALSDGSLMTALAGYEYRIFEVNPR